MTNQLAQYNELMPATLQDKLEMAKYLAQSELMPGGLNTPAKVLVALQMGHELGLSPMVSVNNIAVINGRPSLSSSIMEAIARNHPDFAGISINYGTDQSNISCTVTIKRRIGQNVESYEGYFDMQEAADAGLTGKDNWKKYKRRMVKARASSFACRDAFPDALAGIMTYDEAADGVELEPRDVTPQKAPESIKKGGADTDIPIDDFEAMLSDEEAQQIAAKMGKVEAYIEKNEKYLTEAIITFAREKAKGNCLRHYYRTGKEPTKYLDDVLERMRAQVAAAKEKEKDANEKKTTEQVAASSKLGGAKDISDAEIVTDEPPDAQEDQQGLF